MEVIYVLIAFGVFYMLIKVSNSSKKSKNKDKSSTTHKNSKTNIYKNLDRNINSLFEEGKRYENEGDYEKAIIFYNEILKKDLNNVDAWIRKGICLYKLRKFKLSIECMDKALKLDRKNYLAWFFKGNALMELKKYEDALKCYNYALNLAPPSEKAKILNNKKLLEEKLCKDNQDFERIKHFIKKGRNLLLKNDYNNALIEFKKVLMRDKYNIEALFGVGYCLNALNKFDEALGYWNEYLRLNPKDASGWFNKGVSLYNLKDYKNAIYCFKKVIELNPKDVDSYLFIINAYLYQKDYNGALEYVNEILKINPHWKFWKIKGDIYYSMKRYKDAIDSYKNALKYVKDEEIYISIGNAYKNIGDFKNALTYYEYALKLNPKNIIAKNLISKINSMIDKKTEEYINLSLYPTTFYFNEWNEATITISNKTKDTIKNISFELNANLFEVDNIEKINYLPPNSSIEITFLIKPKKKGEIPYEIKLSYERNGIKHIDVYEEYIKVSEPKMQQKSIGKEIYYCSELFLIHLKYNDLYKALGYLYDLKKYAEKNKSEMVKDIENLLNEINYRIKEKIGVSDDFYKRSEVIIERIKLGN
ncbi:TPR repeat-containing protein [Methanocaldococcus vulcanius M7]|uniref:TPR repeat-containing protein n=1 Tax=Methanocaldococcus vulcanius (strain ATCC 700851 / DSM 12094 / M7) TaxID=579137 RepID=C9RH04_METVM|nr:tetratricopeptide repeat protein [Methanocaldococcus vulcanius]ACX72856.1 TPR repeat-containing protein [Methanocaldococcus vulcanius M7]